MIELNFHVSEPPKQMPAKELSSANSCIDFSKLTTTMVSAFQHAMGGI